MILGPSEEDAMWIMALACLRLDHSFFDILLAFSAWALEHLRLGRAQAALHVKG